MPSLLSNAINQLRGNPTAQGAIKDPLPPVINRGNGGGGGGGGVNPNGKSGRALLPLHYNPALGLPGGGVGPGRDARQDARQAAMSNAQGLIGQGWNPGMLQQYLAANPGANPGANLQNIGGYTPNAAGGVQQVGRPQGINPALWRYLNSQPNAGGVGGPVVNPGGQTGNLPTYLNKHAPNASGVERF